jgi:hypothetical protein
MILSVQVMGYDAVSAVCSAVSISDWCMSCCLQPIRVLITVACMFGGSAGISVFELQTQATPVDVLLYACTSLPTRRFPSAACVPIACAAAAGWARSCLLYITSGLLCQVGIMLSFYACKRSS